MYSSWPERQGRYLQRKKTERKIGSVSESGRETKLPTKTETEGKKTDKAQ